MYRGETCRHRVASSLWIICFGFPFEIRGMRRSSLLVIFGSAAAVGAAPAAATAQTMDRVNDPTQLVLGFMASDPFLALALFLTAVLILGKGLDLIRSFRDRRQRNIESLKEKTQLIGERLHAQSGRKA